MNKIHDYFKGIQHEVKLLTNKQTQTTHLSNFKERIKSVAENKDQYDNWATNYDQEVEGINYQAPRIIIKKLLKYISTGTMLDIGCGTGLSGEAVKQQQPNSLIIDGCDYSQGMLDVAASKNVYRSLVRCDINNMPFEDLSYDAAISVGVFLSKKHRENRDTPDSRTLAEVIRILKPDGYFILSVSEKVWEADAQDYQTALTNLPVKVIQITQEAYHDAIPTMQCIVLQKT